MSSTNDARRQAAPLSPAYRTYAMGLLFVIYIFNLLDRQVVAILAEAIKADLHLADWHLGILTGLAFALFYTLLGIPIARLSDRHNRAKIIAISLAVWSLFTALCGLARNFAQLALLRVAVGVGEAGCTPAAHSLITDYFSRDKRALALSVYAMGNPVGVLVGLALGGLVAQAWGWRVAFFVAGAPGVVLAVLALLTLKDPRPPGQRPRGDTPAEGGFRDTMRRLAPKRSYWLMAVGMAASVVPLASLQSFAAPFFLRIHGEGVARLAGEASAWLGLELKPIGFLGLALGVASGAAGALGMLLGGLAADRLGRTDERGYLTAPMIACLVAGPTLVLACLAPSALGALAFWGLGCLLLSSPTGPVFAAVQTIAPARGRAMAAAILLFILNLIGAGFGPLVTGALSDLYNGPGRLGPAEGVRAALITVSLAGPVAAALFWAARRTIRQDCRSSAALADG